MTESEESEWDIFGGIFRFQGFPRSTSCNLLVRLPCWLTSQCSENLQGLTRCGGLPIPLAFSQTFALLPWFDWVKPELSQVQLKSCQVTISSFLPLSFGSISAAALHSEQVRFLPPLQVLVPEASPHLSVCFSVFQAPPSPVCSGEALPWGSFLRDLISQSGPCVFGFWRRCPRTERQGQRKAVFPSHSNWPDIFSVMWPGTSSERLPIFHFDRTSAPWGSLGRGTMNTSLDWGSD